MMASVVLAGQGLLTPEQIQLRLASGHAQHKQENMAPPHGLCLVEVAYPEDKFTVTERSAFDWDSFDKDQEYVKNYSQMAKERQKKRIEAQKMDQKEE
jgi:tRNA U38,U39,U40 pseudouridine synthase TruA